MSVYRRGDSWYINIMLGGVRINRKAGASKKEAHTAAAELKTKFRLKQLSLEDIQDYKAPFYEVAADYLQHVKTTKSPRTFEMEFTDYNKHLHSYFGNIIAGDLDHDLLRKFQAKQKATGLANRTVNIHIGLVRKIINFGKDNGYLSKNFTIKYPMLKEPIKKHAFLDFEEFDALKDNVTYDRTLKRVLFGRLTGLRPAELAFLAWDDVSFNVKIVKVQAKPKWGWKPKTDEERIIPLGKDALKILEELYKTRKSQWVFSNSSKPVRSIRKSLKTAADKAGINKKVTPNMLRHTFATHALMKGSDLKSVSELLGHTSISTTEKYLHSIQEHLRKTVENLDQQ
jgi:site-specific recombinase XerD